MPLNEGVGNRLNTAALVLEASLFMFSLALRPGINEVGFCARIRSICVIAAYSAIEFSRSPSHTCVCKRNPFAREGEYFSFSTFNCIFLWATCLGKLFRDQKLFFNTYNKCMF